MIVRSSNMKRRLFAGLAAMMLSAGVAVAQDFPSRPIRIIVPFPPGASTDIITRLLAEELRKDLGQTVVVDNRVGATGVIGSTELSRAAPDGYTIGLGNEATHVTGPLLKKTPPYDPIRDFTPLTIAIQTTMAIAINPKVVPANNLAELIEFARKNPGKVAYGTAGVGSPQHLLGELLKQRGGADLIHAPYSGAGPATNDLLAGHIAMVISTLPSLMPQLSKLRVVAIGDSKRLPDMGQIATISETFNDVVVSGWSGYFGPPNLPRPIVNRLNAALVKALNAPAVVDAIKRQQVLPAPGTPEDLANLLSSGKERWSRVIAAANLPKE